MLVKAVNAHAGSQEARTVGVWGVAPQKGESERGKVAKTTEHGGRGGS